MTHELWNFSLSRYGRKSVSDACLALQEAVGADVNVILFLLWAGHTGKRIEPRLALPAIHDTVAEWHETVVCRLRASRQAVKSWVSDDAAPIEKMRKRLKAIEIEAERVEQDMLFNLASDPPSGFWGSHSDPMVAMRGNLLDYLESIGMDGPVASSSVNTLVDRCA